MTTRIGNLSCLDCGHDHEVVVETGSDGWLDDVEIDNGDDDETDEDRVCDACGSVDLMLDLGPSSSGYRGEDFHSDL